MRAAESSCSQYCVSSRRRQHSFQEAYRREAAAPDSCTTSFADLVRSTGRDAAHDAFLGLSRLVHGMESLC